MRKGQHVRKHRRRLRKTGKVFTAGRGNKLTKGIWGVEIEYTFDDIDGDSSHPDDWEVENVTYNDGIQGELWGDVTAKYILNRESKVSQNKYGTWDGWAIFTVRWEFKTKSEAKAFYQKNEKYCRSIMLVKR